MRTYELIIHIAYFVIACAVNNGVMEKS